MRGFNPKLIATAVVGGAHIGLAGLLSLVVPSRVTGGAPALLVTLEPIARFDGDDGAEPSDPSASASASGGGPSAAEPPPLRLRATTMSRPDLAAQVIAAPVPPPLAQQSALPSKSGVSFGSEDLRHDSGSGESAISSDQSDRSSRAGRTGGGGAPTLGAQAAAQEDRYAAEVIAWIESHKRHPGGHIKGVVGVEFVLDRNGRLRDARIINASGSAPLDQTALTQLAAMQPFPKPAPGARWARRDFAVAIDYRSN